MADGQITQVQVQQALAAFKDPETGRSALQMDQIRDIQVRDGVVSLTLALSTHSAPLWQETQQALEQTLRTALPQVQAVHITRVVHDRPAQKLGEICSGCQECDRRRIRQRRRGKEYDCGQSGRGPETGRLHGRVDGCGCVWAQYSSFAGHPGPTGDGRQQDQARSSWTACP